MIMNDSHSSWSTSCKITHSVGVHCATAISLSSVIPHSEQQHLAHTQTQDAHKHDPSALQQDAPQEKYSRNWTKKRVYVKGRAHELISRCFRPCHPFIRCCRGVIVDAPWYPLVQFYIPTALPCYTYKAIIVTSLSHRLGQSLVYNVECLSVKLPFVRLLCVLRKHILFL